jgi:putative addiction module component (TIGR02574 family)
MASVDNAFLAASSLGPEEKLQLISRIWESISPKDWRPSESDLELIKRRWEEFEAGKVQAIPWEQVRDEIRQELERLKANA